MKKKLLRPTFAEIKLSAIQYNFNQIRKKIGKNVQIMGIVKANAYGHGSVEVSKFLQKQKIVTCFGVAFLEEAIELINNNITLPILVLTHPSINQLPAFLQNKVEVTVANIETAKLLNNLSKQLNLVTPIHIKIDTGMGRIGINPKDANLFFNEIKNFKNLFVKGIYTHFASSDAFDLTSANKQLDQFKIVAKKGKEIFGQNVLIHAANSGAVLQMEDCNFDLVRPGIMIYGYYPTSETRKTIPIKKAMVLKSEIVFKKIIPKNTSISYGGLFVSNQATNIATLPIGFADGYPRLLTNKSEVIIKGKKYRIVGQICMDQMMVDIGLNWNFKLGQKVTLIGREKNEEIWFDDLAVKLNNLQYELLCNISARVRRVFVK